jgi:hypothetical protein
MAADLLHPDDRPDPAARFRADLAGSLRGLSGPELANRARATSRRCQRRSVSGLTIKQDQRARGRARLIAASRARSVGSSLGRGTWRRSTVS